MLVIETNAINQVPPIHDTNAIQLSHMRMMHQVDSREKYFETRKTNEKQTPSRKPPFPGEPFYLFFCKTEECSLTRC